jgi:hypothetical protein
MSHRVRGIRQGNDVVWLRILWQQKCRDPSRTPNVKLGLEAYSVGYDHRASHLGQDGSMSLASVSGASVTG